MNKLLHDRVSNIEREYVNFLKKYSEDMDEDVVTSVSDDNNESRVSFDAPEKNNKCDALNMDEDTLKDIQQIQKCVSSLFGMESLTY